MKNSFHEVQKMTQWWLWLLIVSLDLFFLYVFVQQVVLQKPFGEHPAPNEILYIILVVITLINVLTAVTRLELLVDNEGLHYRFVPFIWKHKHIAFSELQELYTRIYNPILEYGGWGFRIGIFGKGRALNMRGNQGLQVVFNDGKKLLLGTQRMEELNQVIQDLGIEMRRKE